MEEEEGCIEKHPRALGGGESIWREEEQSGRRRDKRFEGEGGTGMLH